MIALATLKYLSGQKVRDAEALFQKNRHAGAVYLMGYALEFSFKRKVCQTIGFTLGFPESPSDFNSYTNEITRFTNGTGIALTQVRQIKNHDLNSLVRFSGVEAIILNAYYEEWIRIKDWNPENRYRRQRFTNAMTREFIVSAKKILTQIA